MIDNLRRTLSAPAAWLTLVAGWTLPGSAALVWTAFVLAALAAPGADTRLRRAGPRARAGISKRTHFAPSVRALPSPPLRSRSASRCWLIRHG